MSQTVNYNSHSLVEIPFSEWRTLLRLYECKQTESGGYLLIENYIRWLEKDPSFDAKCFSLDNDWQNDGTFIIIAYNGSKLKEVCFNTLSDNMDRMKKALLCLLASTQDFKLCSYSKRLVPAADACLNTYGSVRTIATYWYTVSKDIIANFSTEPPAGVTVHSLTVADVPTVNGVWPNRFHGSESFVKLLIENNLSVGAYDEKGNLIAWCLRFPTGALALLQVLETHKRLGLGSLMVRCLSKKIAEIGQEVLSPVITVNTPSMKMFEKLGFHQIDEVYWSWNDGNRNYMII